MSDQAQRLHIQLTSSVYLTVKAPILDPICLIWLADQERLISNICLL